MTADPEPTLADLLLTLSAMQRRDRAFVLDALDEETGRRLAPLLNDVDKRNFSTTLQTLSEQVTNGSVPEGMTARAATSMRTAIEAMSRNAAPAASSTASTPTWLDRVAQTLAGRG